ncbi:MAG: hypothetical protein IE937_09720 [Gammaproteobacteria bacterium]|nr:hypothetical protein [Gammaproteobacteria bacterium]
MAYNGWTNWETWQILLWADNEEMTYLDLEAWLKGFARKGKIPTAKDCEDYFKDLYPEGTPDMQGAVELDSVDWQEIANALETRIEDEGL